jgi:hypothetical protein
MDSTGTDPNQPGKATRAEHQPLKRLTSSATLNSHQQFFPQMLQGWSEFEILSPCHFLSAQSFLATRVFCLLPEDILKKPV